MSEKQTVAGAYAKINAHEDLCAERYANIHSAIDDLKSLIWLAIKWVLGGASAICVGLIAWMAVQIYTLNNARVDRLEGSAVVQPVGR